MAIVNTLLTKGSMGNKKFRIVKSVLSGTVATGNVTKHGLRTIEFMKVTVAGATQNGCSIDEVFPLDKTDPTVFVESNDATFYSFMIGE